MSIRGEVVRDIPQYRPRPHDTSGYHGFIGGIDGFEVLVSEQVLRELAHAASDAAPDETIGYLVGRPYRDASGYYAVVTIGLVAAAAERTRTFVQTAIEDEIASLAALRRDHPTCDKMGWWHSHPFAMHEYSDTDRSNQRVVCPRDYQVGLLVCFVESRATIHAFQGPGSHRLDNDFVYTLSDPPHLPTPQMVAESASATHVNWGPVQVNVTIRGMRMVILVVLLMFGLVWPICLSIFWLLIR